MKRREYRNYHYNGLERHLLEVQPHYTRTAGKRRWRPPGALVEAAYTIALVALFIIMLKLAGAI